ncbi:uncharacterized protein LOC141852228 [Brevipalpus obovatus]|uniref:uncharacterized protein LOC141852228 n=1 Tax=Brevipalpus obovatus TaxID=246614 RepID=UPI003D9F9E67
MNYPSSSHHVKVSEPKIVDDASSMSQKELIEIIDELRHHNEKLRHHNEELRQTNRILSNKLDQTVAIINDGFRSIHSALTSIPDQISQSIEKAISQHLPANSDQKVWVIDSESSSITSGANDVLVFDSLSINTDDEMETKKKQRYGFEIDLAKADPDIWLKKD